MKGGERLKGLEPRCMKGRLGCRKSTSTNSITLISTNSMHYFQTKDESVAVAATQNKQWVAHTAPASSAHHTNHQSANTSKQTQTSTEPQRVLKLQGDKAKSFLVRKWRRL